MNHTKKDYNKILHCKMQNNKIRKWKKYLNIIKDKQHSNEKMEETQ